MIAGGLIDLDTTVAELIATAGTSITIDESTEITLTDVQTDEGSITVTAGNTITVVNVVSQMDSDDHDIALTSTGGSIGLTSVDAGTQGDVLLDANGDVSGGQSHRRCADGDRRRAD